MAVFDQEAKLAWLEDELNWYADHPVELEALMRETFPVPKADLERVEKIEEKN